MGRFPISPEKENKLMDDFRRLGIQEQDLVEKFVKGSGPGGQKINKTSSAVYLSHPPSGIECKCQRSRSQIMNRYYARRELVEKLEARVLGEQSKREQQREKLRRQKRRRSRRQKEKMLDSKRAAAKKKQLRRKPEI